MIGKIVFVIFVAGLVTGSPAPSLAQDDLSADEIVRALLPERARTRSINQVPRLSADDQDFVNRLKLRTRAIVVEERRGLASIIKQYDLPRLDLEIYFAYDSANIALEAVGGLVKLGMALSDPQLEESIFVVSGHTDARGPDEYNQTLSEKRALSMKRFLVENVGVSGQRLIAVGYGEEQLKNKISMGMSAAI